VNEHASPQMVLLELKYNGEIDEYHAKPSRNLFWKNFANKVYNSQVGYQENYHHAR